MTRDQAERLIERLADKTLNFGCVIILDGIPVTIVHKNYAGNFLTTWDVGNTGISRTVLERKVDTVLGHPIMLTDVLEKLLMVDYDRLRLVMLWEDCGVTKSLQDILSDAEWHNTPRKAPEGHVTLADMPEQMKGPAKDLFSFLFSLFPET